MKKRHYAPASGFTLVELLVVIGVILFLLALLLPVVSGPIEASRATQCRTNTRNLALAAINYEFRFGRFPGYNEEFGNGSDEYETAVSWVAAILPQLERVDIYKKYPQIDASKTLAPPYMELLVCPSDPPSATSGPANNYVINVGYLGTGDLTNRNGVIASIPDDEIADVPAEGIAHNYAGVDGSGNARHMMTTVDMVISGDGASTTVLISENIQAGGGGSLDGDWTIRHKQANGFGYFSTEAEGKKINADIDKVLAGDDARYARPSSHHTGLVHVAFCDGHAITLREDVSYVVYQQLCSSNSRELEFTLPDGSVPPVAAYELDEADFR